MSYSRPDENTLGAPITQSGRRAAEVARRFARPGTAHRGSLGTTFLAAGAAIVVAIRLLYGFAWFVVYWDEYPVPLAALAAWAVLLAVSVAAVVLFRVTGERMADWMFALFLAALGGAVALDLIAIWGLHDVGRYATAAVSAGMVLLLVLTLRSSSEILAAAGAIGVALAVAMALNTQPLLDRLAQQISTLAFAVLPAVIGVVVVRGFRRMVRIELDRVLVQSTVSAPRFAVGMLASEELARLDLDAEKLLDSVANGEVALPLDPRTASVAASLATELRLHLIEGRRETWLYHAITESGMLGQSVTLTDPSSLAGLLDPSQRDGLLSAVWLIISDGATMNPNRSVHLTLGPVQPTGRPDRRILVPIVMKTTGLPRNRVDPAVWDALGKVGRYDDSTEDASLRVQIECVVESPAEVASTHSSQGR